MITFESTCLLLSSGNRRLLQQSKINMWPDEQIPYLCPAILICSGCLREWFSVHLRVSLHLHYRIYIWIFLRMIRSKISLYLSNSFNKEGHRENGYASNKHKNHSSEKDVGGDVYLLCLFFFFPVPLYWPVWKVFQTNLTFSGGYQVPQCPGCRKSKISQPSKLLRELQHQIQHAWALLGWDWIPFTWQ